MTTLAGLPAPGKSRKPCRPGGSVPHPANWWKVAAASVPGSKRTPEEPCEDAHAWAVEGERLIAAVADGAGSASRSAEGAALAAGFFVEHLCWVLAESGEVSVETIVDSFEATRRVLEELHRREGGNLADYATTLTIAVAGPNEVWAGQIGDGAVVVRAGDDLLALAKTAKGEFLNETTFLTSRSWRTEIVVEHRRLAPDAMALTTDGLALLALDLGTGDPHPPFFEPLFAFCADAEDGTEGINRFLRSQRVASRTDDDLSLLIALPG